MKTVESLTDEQLAGQRLMIGFEGQALSDPLHAFITEVGVGGLILFKRNVSAPDQVAELCKGAQALAREAGQPPLLIAVDQEGGPVARLGPPFSVFPGQRAIGDARSEAAAAEFGAVTGRELRAVGINLNFAPVLDVVPEGIVSPVMQDRVFGQDPELVALLGCQVIEALQKKGVAATAKHFPGIGRTTLDSHVDLPFLDTGTGLLAETDLVPFRAAIARGVAVVMLSHIVYRDIDPTWPAGLSTPIARDLLRGTMGFRGVSVTDDLDMGAIDKHYGVETFVERICRAEVDVALICHDEAKMLATYQALLRAIRDSRDMKRRAQASVQRVLALKRRFAG